MKKTLPARSMQRQKGAVLAISMIFLIIVTLIGVYAANTATMDVRMARNMQAQMESAQAAEAGLNAALETLAPATGDLLFTTVATPTALGVGTLLDNLNTGAASVAVSITAMGKDVTPERGAPSGLSVRSCYFYRVVSGHETADAASTVGIRVRQCIRE